MKWPTGIRSSGVACGIKEGALDLGVIILAVPSVWAGTFTRNAAAAAPVRWCRTRLGTSVRALVVNSGNANACTGPAGEEAVRETASAAARELGCTSEEILIASTGPIGVPLPVDLLRAALPAAMAEPEEDTGSFARAIMTTDTRIKSASAAAGGARVTGVAKGAAMVAPNMATMLAFVATDARVSQGALNDLLREAVDMSFNRISIDGCESTNDSVFAFATGVAGPPPDEGVLGEALTEVCSSLAQQIVRDAEGGTRVIRIVVEGASDEGRASALARAVANSALWRAAAYGADPNWGRVLAALGSVDRGLDLTTTDLAVGPESVFSQGAPCGSLDVAAKAMREPEFTVTCSLHAGSASAEILTTDLSPEYVTLNAEGTT